MQQLAPVVVFEHWIQTVEKLDQARSCERYWPDEECEEIRHALHVVWYDHADRRCGFRAR
jgi:hypothetical protein